MSSTLKTSYWSINSLAKPDEYGAYCVVRDERDRADAELFRDAEAVHLFCGVMEDPLPQIIARVDAWMDFIWGDYIDPWVNVSCRKLLEESGLTGFVFIPSYAVEVGSHDLDHVPFKDLYRLDMVAVPRIYEVDLLSQLNLDYLRVIGPMGYSLLVSEKAVEWLRQSGWKNFSLKPFSY